MNPISEFIEQATTRFLFRTFPALLLFFVGIGLFCIGVPYVVLEKWIGYHVGTTAPWWLMLYMFVAGITWFLVCVSWMVTPTDDEAPPTTLRPRSNRSLVLPSKRSTLETDQVAEQKQLLAELAARRARAHEANQQIIAASRTDSAASKE